MINQKLEDHGKSPVSALAEIVSIVNYISIRKKNANNTFTNRLLDYNNQTTF